MRVDSFDYIVVGAGTAGCVVADRLSEDSARRVLLLEAGGSDRRFWIRLPIGYGRTFTDPRVNWMYRAEPDPGLCDRRGYVPRGKVLGGSGSINAMVYVRGLPQDFDDWRDLGNPGWGFDEVRACFERGEQRIHRTDVTRDAHRLTVAWLESCERLGFRRTADFNGASAEGVGIYRFTTRSGVRESTAGRYLHPALLRANLSLQLRAHALRILIEQRRAVGVQYRQRGRTVEVRARKAVILGAGAINTPQLLQLSGIGPGELLTRHGIPLLAEHPAVGCHLQDHLAVSYFYRSTVPTLNDELHPWHGKLRAVARYLLRRRGPLSMSVNQGGGFVRSDAAQTRPNLQLYFNPMTFTTSPGPHRRLLRPDPFPGFLLSFNACRPTSRGQVEIRSANPLDPPAIQPNSLSSEHDVAQVLAGTRLLRAIAATPPLSGYVAEELRPGTGTQSDVERLADFRARAGSVFHPVGTCRMGPDPAQAVVDARLRVHGLKGLRIIDASVFPTVTSGNTNAPCIMVAEKGAAMMIEDQES
jgi:choline dehydrogenase